MNDFIPSDYVVGLNSLEKLLEAVLKIDDERVYQSLASRGNKMRTLLLRVETYRKVRKLLRLPSNKKLPRELIICVLRFLK